MLIPAMLQEIRSGNGDDDGPTTLRFCKGCVAATVTTRRPCDYGVERLLGCTKAVATLSLICSPRDTAEGYDKHKPSQVANLQHAVANLQHAIALQHVFANLQRPSQNCNMPSQNCNMPSQNCNMPSQICNIRHRKPLHSARAGLGRSGWAGTVQAATVGRAGPGWAGPAGPAGGKPGRSIPRHWGRRYVATCATAATPAMLHGACATVPAMLHGSACATEPRPCSLGRNGLDGFAWRAWAFAWRAWAFVLAGRVPVAAAAAAA